MGRGSSREGLHKDLSDKEEPLVFEEVQEEHPGQGTNRCRDPVTGTKRGLFSQSIVTRENNERETGPHWQW